MENSKNRDNKTSDFLPEIRRGRFGLLTIYEVSDSELEILAKGTPSSIYLNFAIFLFSISISFIIALLTTTIDSIKVFTVFVVIAVVGAIIGILLISMWFKNRRFVSDVIHTIKKRLPPEGVRETSPVSDNSTFQGTGFNFKE